MPSNSNKFLNICRVPDSVSAFGPNGEIRLDPRGDSNWTGSGITVETVVNGGRVNLVLSANGIDVERVRVRWRGDLRGAQLFLGDHWERSYGDLEWRAEVPNRTMPWYFLASDHHLTHGYGVVTGARSWAFWNADVSGISLWLDVRNGGSPIQLGDRRLEMAQVVCREGIEGERPFVAGQALCRQMSPSPRLPEKPVYGTNDWYYAYGNNNAPLILEISKLISDLSDNAANRPFSVIDAGWSPGGLDRGPFDQGNEKFGDMGELAHKMSAIGVRPGIWVRPLAAGSDLPDAWRLSRKHDYLDPTNPGVLAHVRKEIRGIHDWGYQLIKHDFTTWDILGKWGFEMGSTVTPNGWHFQDRSVTSAEAILGLYETIREAAGDSLIIGCNTISHLSAGVFEINRIGDDTSGRNWDRTRRMGINALAFRAIQHGTFYDADSDVAGITHRLPWELAERWLNLVSESGTPLFVSVEPSAVESAQREALRKALNAASHPISVAEPLDWLNTNCPRSWRLNGTERHFDWMSDGGPWPFDD